MGLSESRVKVIAIAATAAALVAAGAALYYYSKATAAGDEPPIRVKGGSFHLHQFGKNGVWEPQNPQPDPKKWQIRSQGRGGPDLLVYFAPKNPVDCMGTVFKTGVKKVKFVYQVGEGEAFSVNVHATGNKTKIDSDRDLKLGSTGKNEVYFDGGGYIKEIWIDNDADAACTFSSTDDLDGVIIGEGP